MLFITQNTLAVIEKQAAAAFPEECCGLLLGRVSQEGTQLVEALPAKNLAEASRTTRYTLDPRVFLEAEERARSLQVDVVGVYHSHPDHSAVPSATDTQLAWDDFLYLIVPVTRTSTSAPRGWRYKNRIPMEVPLTITR